MFIFGKIAYGVFMIAGRWHKPIRKSNDGRLCKKCKVVENDSTSYLNEVFIII